MGINILHKPAINFKAMSWIDRLIVFSGVGFGSGLAPKAPGTFGSAFALLFIPIWLHLGFLNSVFAIAIMSLVGIYICGHTAKVMGVHDDGRIVWDEFARTIHHIFAPDLFRPDELVMVAHRFCPVQVI